MGGPILLAQARAGRSPFARMVLTAPMIDIAGLRFPRLVRALAEALDMVGLGTAYVPGGSRKATLECGFEGNDLTSDPVRFARMAGILEAAPQLGLGGPTVGWLNAAFRLMDEFGDPEYPRRTFTPTLVLAAGKDRVVPLHAVERFATRLKVGCLIVIPDAEHEILMERDHVRAQFWAAFDAFIPGEHFSVAALDAAAEAKRALRSRRRWFRRRQMA
jgi:lysophospholipase